jgi:hypothetical protein
MLSVFKAKFGRDERVKNKIIIMIVAIVAGCVKASRRFVFKLPLLSLAKEDMP